MLYRTVFASALIVFCTPGAFAQIPGPAERYPEGAAVPRTLTPEERRILSAAPITFRGSTPPPRGPVVCPAEYEPMAGLMIAYEGPAAWLNILSQIAAEVTDAGGRIWCYVDFPVEELYAESRFSSFGVDLDRVTFLVESTDSIWIRDYGPRFIYEGGCRAIVDHTYNRPRPNDNAVPLHFAGARTFQYYEIPLTHGGGNFHLDAHDDGYTTRLVVNENPGLTEGEIGGLWQDYQNLAVDFFDPLPSAIDGTQHIDMWMQLAGDDVVVISDWPNSPGSTQDVICDNAAAEFAARGFDVHRVPARSYAGTHYTYTNVVMFNDVVMMPYYALSPISALNAEARAAWEAACPGKTIVQITCDQLVTAAGVLHCIVMHVPVPAGGATPTAHLLTLRGGETLMPGESVLIEWLSDDDEGVTDVELRLSTDGGNTYDRIVASGQAPLGTYLWTVPQIDTDSARLRVIASDADGHSGVDESPTSFTIAAPNDCPADLDGSGGVDQTDLGILLAAYLACSGDAAFNPTADVAGDGGGPDGCVNQLDLGVLLAAYLTACD